MSASKTPALQWLYMGQEIFPTVLAAIGAAQKTIRLETYIFADGQLARRFLEALLAAARRGVRVRVLVDAAGSWFLANNFFDPLIAAGAEVRRFNPLHLWRFGVRDHRKLLVCDASTVFVGGFNVSDEYDGDGVTHGWCELGLRLENPALAKQLGDSFDELFALADFRRKPLMRLLGFNKKKRKSNQTEPGEVLLTRPGRGASPFQAALARDFSIARDVRIISAYFLPTRRMRRDLLHVVRRGGRVQLLLAGQSDVALSQMAARSLYTRLLKAGLEIYEYQPQILHAKLIVSDHVVYAGSSNLDIRSLNLNYELMLRFADEKIGAEAEEIFGRTLKYSKKIELSEWRKNQTGWMRLKYRWSHFLLTRIDPFIALRQFRTMGR